jgi:exosortase/archaeosortase
VRTPPLHILDNFVDAYRTSARHQTACFRSQLLSIDSLYGTALATFSPLPWEIAKVHQQVQSVLDELQVSAALESVFYITV